MEDKVKNSYKHKENLQEVLRIRRKKQNIIVILTLNPQRHRQIYLYIKEYDLNNYTK